MGDKSSIEWTNATWTPIRARRIATGKIGWHCVHHSPGCKFCYAESLNKRLGTGLPFKPGHEAEIEIFLDEKMLLAPLKWQRPRMIFVCSMTDLFADFVPDAMIDKVMAVAALTPHHTYQFLTKRSKRMREYLTTAAVENVYSVACRMDETLAVRWQWPLPNVWAGVSAEDQARYDERKKDLRATPAAVHFFSFEPLLGPINADYLGEWAITGGESGAQARPMHPDWARAIRDQCAAAGVAFFFKQWGEFIPCIFDDLSDGTGRRCFEDGAESPAFDDDRKHPIATAHDREFWRVGKSRAGRLLDGITHNAMPEVN